MKMEIPAFQQTYRTKSTVVFDIEQRKRKRENFEKLELKSVIF